MQFPSNDSNPLIIPGTPRRVEDALRELNLPSPRSVLSSVFGPYSISSETGPIKKVIIGEPFAGVNYDPAKAPPIDHLTRITQESGKFISAEQAEREFQGFRRTLEENGAIVASPAPIAGAYNQIYVRDIAAVIGRTLVRSSMKHAKDRAGEIAALEDLFVDAAANGREIAFCDVPGAIVEFGDIIPHNGLNFVGLGERTNKDGMMWLAKKFPELGIVPLELRKLPGNKEAVHLDCAFACTGHQGREEAVFSPELIVNYDFVAERLRGWHLMHVTLEEQKLLATNVFSINPEKIIVRDCCEGLQKTLSDRGHEVIPLPFDAAAATGGLFRCCSLPLLRA